MLVLSRRRRERIVVNDNILIEVIGLGEGQVRLGFAAPKDVPIRREELADLDRLQSRFTDHARVADAAMQLYDQCVASRNHFRDQVAQLRGEIEKLRAENCRLLAEARPWSGSDQPAVTP